jgi:hypothetical protein
LFNHSAEAASNASPTHTKIVNLNGRRDDETGLRTGVGMSVESESNLSGTGAGEWPASAGTSINFAPSAAESVEYRMSSPSSCEGIATAALHFGQRTVRPASSGLACSLCPFGQATMLGTALAPH